MKTQFKKVPVKYKGKIYAGIISAHSDRVSFELKIGGLTRRCKLAENSKCRMVFDEMVGEIDARGALGELKVDPYLTELDAANRDARRLNEVSQRN